MNSNIRSAYPDPENPESYCIASWRLGEIPPKAWIYPREPVWWRDDDAGDNRQKVIDRFDATDLAMLMEEVNEYLAEEPDKDNVTKLVRRYWSLRFFTEVGELGAAGSHDSASQHYARKYQLQAARFLADNAWRHIMTLPPLLVDGAIRDAIVTPYEFDEDDDVE